MVHSNAFGAAPPTAFTGLSGRSSSEYLGEAYRIEPRER
eukprot:COSAG04_NODE_3375_length_2876_cov_2.214620_1_plen_39_part_00